MCDTTLYPVTMAPRQLGEVPLAITMFNAGAACFQQTGQDIEPNDDETG